MLEVAPECDLSAYDAEFVVLARTLGAPLITLDGLTTADGAEHADGILTTEGTEGRERILGDCCVMGSRGWVPVCTINVHQSIANSLREGSQVRLAPTLLLIP